MAHRELGVQTLLHTRRPWHLQLLPGQKLPLPFLLLGNAAAILQPRPFSFLSHDTSGDGLSQPSSRRTRGLSFAGQVTAPILPRPLSCVAVTLCHQGKAGAAPAGAV